MLSAFDEALDALNKVYPFRLVPEEQKTWLAQRARLYDYEPNQPVYQQGDDAEALYLILDGAVELIRDSGAEDAPGESLGVLRAGDLFGFEIIESRPVCRTTAAAVDGARLLRIDEKDLLDAVQAAPYLHQPLRLMMESFVLSTRVDLPWREPDEAVIFITRRHPVFLWVRLLPALMVAALAALTLFLLAGADAAPLALWRWAGWAAALAGVLWCAWIVVDWSNDYSIITTRRVVFQERVVMLYDSRQEAPLHTVLANTTDTSFVGRLFGYGDLVLKTYTGTIILPAVAQPVIVALILQDRRGSMQQAQRQADLREVRQMVQRRIFPQTVQQDVQASAPEPAANITGETDLPEERGVGADDVPFTASNSARRLANLLQMRYEAGGIITYRQHWVVLLHQVFTPLVLLAGLVVLMVLRAFEIFTLLSSQAGLLLFVMLGGLLLFWLWYQYEDWANDKYILSADELVDVYKKPLGQEEKRSASLKNIQSVEYEKLGLLRLVLNYGTVFIRIGDTLFTFDNVFNPSGVQSEITRRMEALMYREKKKEIDSAREGVLDILEAYEDMRRRQEP